MGLLDRLKKRPSDDEESIVRMLQEVGAEPAQAGGIVATLAERLAPAEMRVWLSDAESSGRTQLVIDAAKRFVTD